MARFFKKLFRAVGPVLKIGLPLALPFLGGPIGAIGGLAGKFLGGSTPRPAPPDPPELAPRYYPRELVEEEEEVIGEEEFVEEEEEM